MADAVMPPRDSSSAASLAFKELCYWFSQSHSEDPNDVNPAANTNLTPRVQCSQSLAL